MLDDSHTFADTGKDLLKSMRGTAGKRKLIGAWSLHAFCAAMAYSGVCATKDAWKELKAELNKNKEADPANLRHEPAS